MTSADLCAICGSPLAQMGKGSPYATCSQCGTVQLLKLPDHESNAAFEGEAAAAEMVAADDARAGYLLRRLKMVDKPLSDITAPRLLEVGCSSGKLLSLAADRGWSVTGIEMSAQLAVEARRLNPQAHILAGDILQLDLANVRQFDAVVALDVIEHVLDPREFLRRMHGLLAPGGQLLLQTPNARSLRARLHKDRWNMLIPEYHFFLFSPRGLSGVLESVGFQVQSLVTVSGSGRETGVGAIVASLKELGLGVGKLGNAMVVKAIKG